MGIKDLFVFAGAPKEKRTQLYFRDDGGIIFRKLDIEDSFLVEKNKANEIVRAWMMRYKLLKHFDGMPGVPADAVTLSFARDIIFDPFNQLAEAEKPNDAKDKPDSLRKKFISKIAEAKCYKHEHEAKGSIMAEKIIWFLGGVAIILALTMLARGGASFIQGWTG